ncbi:MAG: MauE/DoxX family redox-associated membrane protein [Acidobacteriota bacterium]
MNDSQLTDSRPDTSTVPPATWKIWLGRLGGIVLGAVFLVAAWAKTLDPSAFATQITSEGLDFLLPASVVALIALALEVFLGAALLLAVRRLWILLPTAGLVVFFLFLTGRKYWRYAQGIEPDDGAGCGCFGNLVERTPAEAFWQDLFLMVPALLLAFLAFDRGSKPPRVRMAIVGFLAVATALVAWKAPDLPLDNLATRLRPGTDAMTICAGSEEDGTRVCMDGILPELAEGEHIVVMAGVTDEQLIGAVETLNEYHWAASGPRLWLLTDATNEELFTFRFSHAPSFEMREAPPALLRPLYRTLPRSFLVRDGSVVETYSGLPPFDQLGQPSGDS